MSRREKSLGVGPAKRKGDGMSASPTTPTQPVSSLSDSPPPPAYAPCWPGFGASSGSSSFPHGNQVSNPWGGYFNFIQHPHFPLPPQLGESFHFVGLSKNMHPPALAPPPNATGIQTEKNSIEIDDDDGVAASRPVKKRYWTHDEEVRLASAWLNTSKDPIHGNDKKGDSFCGQVTEEFNENCLPDRTRDTNQLKIHWSCLSKTINEFNDFWTIVSNMNKSGYSDDQLMDEAQQRFEKKNGKPFTLVHWWKILKNEPKWRAHVGQSEKEKKQEHTCWYC